MIAQTFQKNKFYVVRGPVWDRKIVKVKKKGKSNYEHGKQ